MGNNYILSLTPTFTQGLIFGQLSIIFLLIIILKYLFLESGPVTAYSTSNLSTSVPLRERAFSRKRFAVGELELRSEKDDEEGSAAWFNLLLRQIVETYRSKLRDDLPGADGEEVARQRVERFANDIRPEAFVDPIRILSVDLGCSAPRISRAKVASHQAGSKLVDKAELDMTYTDTMSISLSTAVLFHYPVPFFVRLPVTLDVSLSVFSSTVILTPPNPLESNPTLTISLAPNFTLNLDTASFIGSRTQLANVPKLHEMIQAQVRHALAERGTWKIVMPWLTTVKDVKEELAHSSSSVEEDA